MKRLSFLLLALALPCFASAQAKTPPTLKSILLEQLHTTHDQEDWFVPANIAIAGLTPEQASWTPGKGNHSVGQLTVHLIFWNKQQLAKFKGEAPAKYSGDNNETFNSFDAKSWPAAVKELDSVMKEWEAAIQSADEKKLESWYPIIARITTHNAYHVGQIIYVRKLQGVWNPDNGVKG
jgi:hypothetical protein